MNVIQFRPKVTKVNIKIEQDPFLERSYLYVKGTVSKNIWHRVELTDDIADVLTKHIRERINSK